MDILRALLGHPRSVHNASVAVQGAGFAADTYLVGSSCLVPRGQLQVKSKYRCVFSVTKTAAGVAAPVISLRVGTAGSTADAARCVLTFAAQTAVIDEGLFEVEAVFRTVGASAVLQALGYLSHRLSVTGLSVDVGGVKLATSATFDSTVLDLIVGLSVNGGASAAWTVQLVSAELVNLT